MYSFGFSFGGSLAPAETSMEPQNGHRDTVAFFTRLCGVHVAWGRIETLPHQRVPDAEPITLKNCGASNPMLFAV